MKDFKIYLHNKITYTCNALKESLKRIDRTLQVYT